MTGYAADQLDQALEGVKVVVIPAGVPRKVCTSFFLAPDTLLTTCDTVQPGVSFFLSALVFQLSRLNWLFR